MKLLDRYITRDLLVTALLAVALLSLVLVLGNVFKQLLERLVTNDAPLDLILSLIAYILPFSLTFTIPWGFLTAVLLVFGKLSAEHELIALRSSGISIPRLCVPVFILATICVAICLWINVEVAPRAQAKMKDAIYNIATSNPLAMFGPDKVIDAFPGRKIYIERNEGAELFNLLVYELNDEMDPLRVVFARRGLLETDEAKKQLLLHIYDARFEQRNEEDPENLTKLLHGVTMKESTLPISLTELFERNKKRAGIGQQTVGELLQRMDKAPPGDDKASLEEATGTLTEVNKRFSLSLASLAFALIGIPLAITAHRRETSMGFLFSLIVAFVYFFFIIIADTLRHNPASHPELLVWVPNILFVGIGAFLFRRLSHQ